MAIFDSDYFSYDGILSTDMGVVLVQYDQQDLFQEPFVASRTLQEITVNHRKRPYFQRIVDTPITLTIQIAFQDAWDSDSIREVARWLQKPVYKELWFSDNPDRIFYAMQTGDSNLNHNAIKQGYINLQFRCDAPYTYSPVYVSPLYDLSTNQSGGTVLEFDNNGDLDCTPEVWITKVGNSGAVTITNQSDASQPVFQFQGVDYATGQFVFYGNVSDGDTISIGNEVYTIVTEATTSVFNDNLTISTNWTSISGTGTFGITGWTSTAKGSVIKGGSGWKPATSTGGTSEPLTVQATFITPASIVAGDTQFELRLYVDDNDYYTLYATDTTLYLAKGAGSPVVMTTLSSVTQAFGASASFTATLSIDTSGNLKGQVYSGSIVPNSSTPLQTLTAKDSNQFSNATYLIALGGDNGTIATNAIVTAPYTISGFQIDCTAAQDANTAASAFAQCVNVNSQVVTASSNGDTTTVTAKSLGVAGEYRLDTTVPAGAWTNSFMDGGDGLVDGETVYVDNENMDIVSSMENSGIYRYNAFNDGFLSLPFGKNNLLIEGNCQIQFRYQFKTIQG